MLISMNVNAKLLLLWAQMFGAAIVCAEWRVWYDYVREDFGNRGSDEEG